ncbi:protein shisa-4 isoform X3 [Hypanus sabinus]|uniref:protein shisa-4 isoform X3 n=1 Tax=Hypanus sabinus TaxID=79690 RepID=UPI0028C50D60|nr:protein shisa-4 isoform X3 [Hypanus sabinus]
MGLVRDGRPLLAALLLVGVVSAGDDCLWYTDKRGIWHIGFDCSFFQFCCGNCTYRYCCLDPLQQITERQQKYCAATNLSPKTIAGIASALFLFIVIIGIIVCCFLCSCCYLYRRRHQLREQFAGPREVVHSYPMHPAYPSNVSPGMQAPYPTAPAYGAAGIHNRTKKYNRMNEKLHTKTDKLCKYRRNKLSQRFSELPTEPSLPTQHTSWIVSSIPDSPSLQCYNCSATVLVRKRECCAFPDAVSMCAISWQQACSRTRFPRIPSLFAVDGLQ